MKKLGQYLLANNTRAAIVALFCSLLPLMGLPGGFLSAIIVGFVTLRKGYKSGLFTLAFVALPAISLLALRQFEYGLFDILLAHCILVWVFALILRRTKSWTTLLEIITVLGVIGVIAVHLLFPDIKTIWAQLLTSYYKHYGWAKIFHVTPEKTARIVHYMAPVLTGGLAFLLFFETLIQLLLARLWESTVAGRSKLKVEFNAIRIDRVAATILMVATVGLHWNLPWLLDLYPVLLLPFMVAGLSLLHRWLGERKELSFLLVLVYIGLVIFNFMAVLILAMLGFIDSWYRFRERRQLLPKNG